MTYRISSFLQLWAQAVTKVGSTDTKQVVAVLNESKDAPTLIGPRSFTPKLHVQTQNPMFVVSFEGDKETAVETWTISQTIPDAVLYRLKK